MFSRRTTPAGRALLLLLMAFFSITPLFSATAYKDILESAKSSNIQVQNAELAYQNSLITIEKTYDIEDTVTVTLSTGTLTVYPLFNNTETVTQGGTSTQYAGNLSLSPSVTVVLPNDGSTTITASTGMTYDFENAGYYNYTPKLGASHTFDLTGYDSDSREALDKSKSILESEQSYQSSLLSFEAQVLTAITNLVTAEQEIASQTKELADRRRELENSLELGEMSEGTVLYRQSVNQIALLENTLKAQQRQLENAKAQYKTLTSLDWDGVSDLPEPDLAFTELRMGNTTVILKQLEAEIAADDIQAQIASDYPKSLALSGEVSSSFVSSDSSTSSARTNTVDGNVGVSYSAGSWTLSSGVGGQYSSSANTVTPYITVAGTWSNKPISSSSNKTERERELELQRLSNVLITAENEYQNELTSYIQSALELEVKILQYGYEAEQQQANTEYLESELEYQKELFEAGLATAQEVADAEFEVEQNSYDEVLLVLEGLQLENEIRVLNL